jgi:hypothetical protein
MAVTAPPYVLEESLSSQKLWKHTAGQRPPQPVEERAFYEKMWSQNFARSQVKYNLPPDVLTAASPVSLSPFAEGCDGPIASNDYINSSGQPDGADQVGMAEATLVSLMHDAVHHKDGETLPRTVKGHGSDGDLTILVRGVNAFGTTVSKSFARHSDRGGVGGGIDTINISIASYRVVESSSHGKHAQFLVIYREGSIRDTLGVWKRYRHFEELARTVTQAHDGCAAVIANVSPLAVTEEPETEHLPNAITSWRLLKKRQRWYRCLDSGYLSLKVFLLERFLHDILFESTSPKLLREFVGAGGAMA